LGLAKTLSSLDTIAADRRYNPKLPPKGTGAQDPVQHL
jgi:hypothetical protein